MPEETQVIPEIIGAGSSEHLRQLGSDGWQQVRRPAPVRVFGRL